jgi:hypothetical protein
LGVARKMCLIAAASLWTVYGFWTKTTLLNRWMVEETISAL